MQFNFDLHTHSNASDGSFTPGDLVKLAAESGVTTLALTDHDTVSGVSEALDAGKHYGVKVIPGTEISIDFSPGTMHICGYYLDMDNPELQAGLNFVQTARRNRNPRIVEKLNALGVDITLEEVKAVAGPDQVGRPHFAKVLVRKGYAKNTQEVFDKYLAKGAPAYMDKARLPLDRAIAMIQGAGGVAVLAHPVTLRLADMDEYRGKIGELKDAGVVGIEVFNSYQNESENQAFFKLAKEMDMIITAGSDFHGDTKPNVKLGCFGENVPVTIDEIIESIQLKRKKV